MKHTRMRRFTFRRTDMWREGKWLDLWSVVHFLSGLSVGFALYIIHFASVESFVIAFILFVAYEFWEAMVEIEETPTNRFMDVVVGMVSFALAISIAPLFTKTTFIYVFAVVLIANIVLATLGWVASRKAAALERRLRARYERGKLRARARMSRLHKRLRK